MKWWTIKCADGYVVPLQLSKRSAKWLAKSADRTPGPNCAHKRHEVVRAS